jgi:AraC family transcriptional regulator
MKTLKNGDFFGIKKKEYKIKGITVVNSAFQNYADCPWHYHENAHFAFTTKGSLTEFHKNRRIDLSVGCLMYNHSQDPHCNSNYSENVAALHIDIDKGWFDHFGFNHLQIEGVHLISDPLIKRNMFHIYKEVCIFDDASPIAIEALIVQSINLMVCNIRTGKESKPAWVNRLKDLLYLKCSEQLTLASVASELNIHPVYLCQQFPFFFKCHFEEYIRLLRIEKAMRVMLTCKETNLTGIAYECGFADQSHFTRSFKEVVGVTPLRFRKYISG